MSAKGLPPAVRLDPLVPHPLSSTHNFVPHYQSDSDAKPFRPPPSSSYVVAEPPNYMSKTPPISNNQVAHVNPRGLTPIIITPSSSRAHTPVQLLPLLPSLAFPQLDTTTLGKAELKKFKLEPNLEPVNLEPLLPTRREETPRVTVVVDDVDDDNDDDGHDQPDPRTHVHRNNHQLPTPHTTPITQPLDTIHKPDSSFTRGRGPEPEFRYTSTRTGKTVTFALDRVRPLSLDPDLHSHFDPSFADQGFVRERDVIDRGRKRERGPSRFRTHERVRQRPVPYNTESRPGGVSCKNSSDKSRGVYTGKLNLGDIAAAAAALAMNEADQLKSTSGTTTITTSSYSNSTPTTDPTASTTPSPNPSFSTAAIPPQQSNMPTPTPTPPHHHHHHHNSTTTRQQQQQTNYRHSKEVNSSYQAPRPSLVIHDAAEEMIQLFATQFQAQMARERESMQEHVSRERQHLSDEIQRERERLEVLSVQVQRDREQVEREREMLRGQVEKEIRAENEELKMRVGQLQAALDDRGREGRA